MNPDPERFHLLGLHHGERFRLTTFPGSPVYRMAEISTEKLGCKVQDEYGAILSFSHVFAMNGGSSYVIVVKDQDPIAAGKGAGT